jgi:hypothetical protein
VLLLLLGPQLFPIILFLTTTLSTGMSGNSLQMQMFLGVNVMKSRWFRQNLLKLSTSFKK